MNRTIGRWAIPLAVLASNAGLAAAAAEEQYETRLASLPMDMITRDSVAGWGKASAVLSGKTLKVSATFEGLSSNATAAHLRDGIARGARGPVIAPLTVSGATSGTVSGTVTLKPAQLASLRAGRLYVQIDSAKAADGNLWGWLHATAISE
ncbi:MAG: hypothetical protein JWN66_1484 [Sphingomonas bacterium]|uniref:CHRD domain-containing protein n=1 Tax=Sphingomonas bacterium TaxID=1895847 RepID=UPI00262C20E8|nr:CHRD domain-containing protein [Sphingomonas bacterium]MDB5704368.1 hypothetical protein [Sphingomonas bacterium]